jgi:hypothetical protein
MSQENVWVVKEFTTTRLRTYESRQEGLEAAGLRE